jgi:hypothetical protein
MRSGAGVMVCRASSSCKHKNARKPKLPGNLCPSTTGATPQEEKTLSTQLLIMPESRLAVHRKSALHFLLRYATRHKHSEKWIGPLTLLIAREEATDGD